MAYPFSMDDEQAQAAEAGEKRDFPEGVLPGHSQGYGRGCFP